MLEYLNKYYLEKKVNSRIINFIVDNLNQIEKNRKKNNINRRIYMDIKIFKFEFKPTFTEKKKIDIL